MLAMAAQVLCSLIVAAIVWLVWRGPADTLSKAGVLAAATPLATPYVFDYDLVLLVLPLVIAARTRPLITTALYLAPIGTRALAVASGIGLAPVMAATLLWLNLRALPGKEPLGDADAKAPKPSKGRIRIKSAKSATRSEVELGRPQLMAAS
jgi:hypothetical protein